MSDYWETWRKARRAQTAAAIGPATEATLIGAKLAGLTAKDFTRYRREQAKNRKALGLPPLPRAKKKDR